MKYKITFKFEKQKKREVWQRISVSFTKRRKTEKHVSRYGKKILETTWQELSEKISV